MKNIPAFDGGGSLINVAALEDWMAMEGMPSGKIRNMARLTGGSQNILVRFSKGESDYVLRRPPANLHLKSNETMRREARVLAALAQTDVPHPHLIAACDDESVLGTVFYLMQPVDGFCATVAPLPMPHSHDRSIREAMGLALVDGAAALARVNYRAVGLEDFGKPHAYLERQVARWRSQLESYASHDAWPGPNSLPGVAEVGDWLEQNRPPATAPGIIHGDYSIGNVMYRHDGPELAAIVDWELATIGDPLIDLGWILATWRDPRDIDIGVLHVEPFDGFPEADELVSRYAKRSGRSVIDIDWYAVLACFKLAIILEGSFARSSAGLISRSTGERLHFAATQLVARAIRRIENA